MIPSKGSNKIRFDSLIRKLRHKDVGRSFQFMSKKKTLHKVWYDNI